MSLSAVEDSIGKSNLFPAAEYLNTLAFAARLLQFPISAGGRYFMLPFHTKGGYDIWGCDVPVVLSELEGTWSFIRECYCSSVMDGEASDVEDSWNDRVRKFDTC
jgi:hypothetical protein